MYERLIGKTIEIVSLDDPYAQLYVGKRGVVESVEKDPYGDYRLQGTWGYIAIYPKCDTFEIIN